MIRICIGIVLLSISIVFFGCFNESEAPNEILVEYSVFDEDAEGWIPEFSGFPAEMEDSMKLGFIHEPIYVSESIGNVSAFKQSGYAANSNLFMYIKQQVSGLRANARYLVKIEVELNSQLLTEYNGDLDNAYYGSFLKIGAFKAEPATTEVPDVLNADIAIVATDFDKGDINKGGDDMVLLGRIEYTNIGETPIMLNGKNTDNPIYAVTDDEGKLWVAVGIDTNIPVYQEIAYTYIVAQFEFQSSL